MRASIRPWARGSALLTVLAVALSAIYFGWAAEMFDVERVVQMSQQRYGGNAGGLVRGWVNALNLFRSETEQQKLADINEYFNRRLRFVSDQENWGQEDYWATPIEALTHGAGDCEDYAIAKYFSLKFIGVPVTKLRITYVKARIGGPGSSVTQAHMVLLYYSAPDAEPVILDNLVSEIRPASRRNDLTPIFSFNSEGVFAQGGTVLQTGSSSRLSRWTDLLEKMKAEGID